MNITCPNPKCGSSHIICTGFAKPRSDMSKNHRYRCKICHTNFSDATLTLEYRQKKPELNEKIQALLSSGVCLNQIARILHINRKTVAQKLVFLGRKCQVLNEYVSEKLLPVQKLLFDELETFQHTKCKPYSVAVAVDEKRLVRGFKVSEMPARGKLAKVSQIKYGKRKDDRKAGLNELMSFIQPQCDNGVLILSDRCPRYRPVIEGIFTKISGFQFSYQQHKGRSGRYTAQGELKQGGYDPLFRINHTFAKFRAGISRLIRKTWNTTKDMERFQHHLNIFIWYHNWGIIQKSDYFSRVSEVTS